MVVFIIMIYEPYEKFWEEEIPVRTITSSQQCTHKSLWIYGDRIFGDLRSEHPSITGVIVLWAF